jgi:hypothetical protein
MKLDPLEPFEELELEFAPPPSPLTTLGPLELFDDDDEEEDEELPVVSPTDPLISAIVPDIGARRFVAASAFSASVTLSSALSTAASAAASVMVEPLPPPPAPEPPPELVAPEPLPDPDRLDPDPLDPDPLDPDPLDPEPDPLDPVDPEPLPESELPLPASLGEVVVGVVVLGAVVVLGVVVVVAWSGVVDWAARATVPVSAIVAVVALDVLDERAAAVVDDPDWTSSRVSCADWRLALASARSTFWELSSMAARSWSSLTCWPSLT